ncbi:MAG: PTS fructose transporter subunit IIABC [Enterobacteriaceae bacterium]
MITTLINRDLICLDLKADSKQALFAEMAHLLAAQGKVSDEQQFITDLWQREQQGNTGFEEGIALPHAKSAAVTQASCALGISRQGIEYGAEDGQPTHIVFMIASPVGNADQHIEILAEISSKLIEEHFIQRLLAARTSQEALDLLLEGKAQQTPVEEQNKRGFLIGVTGCPAGIAHTYLAAEALQKAATSAGYQIKVETNGSVGVKNSPTAQEIAQADAIIVASDKAVDLNRFAGKPLVKTGVKAAIKDAPGLIEQALKAPPYQADTSAKEEKTVQGGTSVVYRSLMNGVSYMIPFVITGGLLIALALAIGGVPTENGIQVPPDSLWNSVLQIGAVSFKLMIPILAGYIAYAIADRPALVPGLIGGWIANDGSFYHAAAGTGFIGAIIAGFIAGYLVRWIVSIHYHKMLQPLVPILIAPIISTLIVAALFILVIGAPIATMMTGLEHLLLSMSGGSLVLLGIVLGGMAGFDMGGPVNKVAFLFSVGMISSGQTQFMGAMACAIPVAPLGMSLATFLGHKMNLFDSSEIEAGKAAGAMGLVGISEGAIPFAARDPLAVIPANMLGSMVAAVMAFMLHITNNVAHGGPIIALLGAINKPLLALLCMFCGAIVTAFTAIALKSLLRSKKSSPELQ